MTPKCNFANCSCSIIRMTDMVQERPYVSCVFNEHLHSVCSNCFRQLVEVTPPCVRCKKVYYCGETCQKKDWNLHSIECKFLSSVRIPPSPIVRLIAQLLIKRKREGHSRSKAYNGRTFDDLMDHNDDIKNNTIWMEDFAERYYELSRYVSRKYMISREETLSYYGKLKINLFNIEGSNSASVGNGLYIGISVHDHSCKPDLFQYFSGSTLILRSKSDNLTYNDKLLIPYVSTLLTTPERRTILHFNYFFECKCPRCEDKEEDGIARSISCSSCPDGICLVNDDSLVLQCRECRAVSNISPDEAHALNRMLTVHEGFKSDHMTNIDSMFLTTLFEEMSKKLSRKNTQLAHLAYRLSLLHTTTGDAVSAAKYASICEEALISKIPLGHDNLTSILKVLTQASALEDPRSANTKRLCEKLRQSVLASNGPEEMVTASGDIEAINAYNILSQLEDIVSLQTMNIGRILIRSLTRTRRYM
ncbi:hypothetical protein PMAYCL1PPCAC_02700 [Pristionchus mayeri]|uniref:MYND-type domain-containing protein n=1 Tax=Pristionchus mayeri TaxID=1317129 RepID=A0AAN4Z8L6_9BILA|nr:hypothetical protein PMAYCL1PPCAC_02700 [Pristionchus mayeri]